MQNMVAAKNGGWGGHMGEVVPSRAFFIFLFPSMRPHSGVGTGGSGGSMNRGPELLGPPSSGATETF